MAISGESNWAMFGKYFEHPLLSSLKRSRAEQPSANANINADTLSHQPLMMRPLNGCLRAAVSCQPAGLQQFDYFLSHFGKNLRSKHECLTSDKKLNFLLLTFAPRNRPEKTVKNLPTWCVVSPIMSSTGWHLR